MPGKARTHDESRAAVCVACLNKTKKTKKRKHISSDQINKIRKQIPDYDLSNRNYPSTLCANCSINLNRNLEVQFVDYSLLSTTPEDKAKCSCIICTVARAHRYDYQKLHYSIERQSKPGVQPVNVKKTQKTCVRCFQAIGRGISHKCNIRNKIENTIKAAGDLKQEVASTILSSEMRNSEKIRIKRSRGHSLEVQKITKKTKLTQDDCKMNGEDLKDVQVVSKASFSAVRKIASKWRQKNQGSVKWGAVSELNRLSHKFDDLFAINQELGKPIVYCKNLSQLVFHIAQKRGLTSYHCKFGIDSGGNSLKVRITHRSLNKNN